MKDAADLKPAKLLIHVILLHLHATDHMAFHGISWHLQRVELLRELLEDALALFMHALQRLLPPKNHMNPYDIIDMAPSLASTPSLLSSSCSNWR